MCKTEGQQHLKLGIQQCELFFVKNHVVGALSDYTINPFTHWKPFAFHTRQRVRQSVGIPRQTVDR